MPTREPVKVPLTYPTALIAVDESGSQSNAGFFVLAGVKTRYPGQLARAIHSVREKHGYMDREFKFSRITRDTVGIFDDLIATVEASDAHLTAFVVDCTARPAWSQLRRSGKAAWEIHADLTAQLLVGSINKRELVSVMLDGISTPTGCSLSDTVRDITNRRLRSTAVITAVCVDSKTNDLVQVADLFAGAIMHERRRAKSPDRPRTAKGQVALRLGYAFDRVGLADGKSRRVNIETFRGPTQAERVRTAPLIVVNRSSRAG